MNPDKELEFPPSEKVWSAHTVNQKVLKLRDLFLSFAKVSKVKAVLFVSHYTTALLLWHWTLIDKNLPHINSDVLIANEESSTIFAMSFKDQKEALKRKRKKKINLLIVTENARKECKIPAYNTVIKFDHSGSENPLQLRGEIRGSKRPYFIIEQNEEDVEKGVKIYASGRPKRMCIRVASISQENSVPNAKIRPTKADVIGKKYAVNVPKLWSSKISADDKGSFYVWPITPQQLDKVGIQPLALISKVKFPVPPTLYIDTASGKKEIQFGQNSSKMKFLSQEINFFQQFTLSLLGIVASERPQNCHTFPYLIVPWKLEKAKIEIDWKFLHFLSEKSSQDLQAATASPKIIEDNQRNSELANDTTSYLDKDNTPEVSRENRSSITILDANVRRKQWPKVQESGRFSLYSRNNL